MSRLSEIVRRFKGEILVYRRVLHDVRTPRVARWLLAAAVAYALSPIALIPDVVPVLGQLDDVIVLPLLVWMAVRMIPPHVVKEHRDAVRAQAELLQASPAPEREA